MFRTWMAVGLVALSGVAEAKELVNQRFVHPFGSANWSVFAQRDRDKGDRLIALNRDTFQVEVLNPITGETVMQDKLDTRNRYADVVETLALSTGEFVIAFATKSGIVELHSVDGEESFETAPGAHVKSLSLIERNRGEVFLAVVTDRQVKVYHRAHQDLQLIQRIVPATGVRSAKLLRAMGGEILVQTLEGNENSELGNKPRLLQINVANRTSEDILDIPVTGATHAEGVLSEGADFILAKTNGKSLRFYIDSTKKDTPSVAANLKMGSANWMRADDGRWLFTAVSFEKNATRLNLYDPYSLDKPIRLGVADAKTITDVGSIGYVGQPLFYFVKDGRELVIQNENVMHIVGNKSRDRIMSVQPVRGLRGQRGLAVVLEGENGTRLLMVGLK